MKKIVLFLLIVFCLPFALMGCKQETKLNEYFIDVIYDDETQTLNCQQKVLYVNNSENALEEVCFYLYANAFKEEQVAVPLSYENKAYPNGKSYGNIEFEGVAIGENYATFDLSKEQNILSVDLNASLYPDEVVEINLKYTISLANINHRLGYGENAVNFGNFFPIACVYENGRGFVENGFSASGDPFYSDISNFYVNITYPQEYVLASSGNQLNTTEEEEKTTTCHALNVRDFCFVLSDKFEKISKKSGEVEVNYYFYDDENAQKFLDTAVLAVKTFQELFGEYPYQQLSVVKTNFCFGGMEYPNLVMISDEIQDEQSYNYVIVHEIAHQWWYGVVGNNQFEEAWLDEGLTEYSCALFFEQNPEYVIDYKTIIQNATDGYKKFVEIFSSINGDVDESMSRSLDEFATEPEYVNCIYTKGMIMYDSLRSSMSDRKFLKCLRDYYEKYAFKNSSTQVLIKSFSSSARINLRAYFDSWLNGDVVVC